MLIEFSVENFRSIRDKQTLSLVASNYEKELPGNVILVDLPGMAGVDLLKSAVLYGANASGKSNLLKAARFMQRYVVESATSRKPNEPTAAEPFRLDRTRPGLPTKFEVAFVHRDVRYEYGFSLDAARVLEEWLLAYPKGRPQSWIERVYDSTSGKYSYDPCPSLKGQKSQLAQQTRPNALFLSVGAQLNNDQLGDVYDWFKDEFRFLDCAATPTEDLTPFTASMLESESGLSERVVNLLRSADLGIVGVELERSKVDPRDMGVPDDMPEDLRIAFETFREKLSAHMGSETKRDDSDDMVRVRLAWRHRTGDGDSHTVFHSEQESTGTLKYLALLGPWLDTLENGYTVFLDEAAALMHPLLTRQLVGMMNDPKQNSKGAQLVFTTHDVTLLDQTLFRRDQIWFTEKGNDGATNLFPLSDFKVRKGEALLKGYLSGRYGGTPFFAEEFSSQ